MLESIRSHKFQETVSYYAEDIILCECGEYVANGVGDRTGTEYDLIFDETPSGYRLRDVRLHNQ